MSRLTSGLQRLGRARSASFSVRTSLIMPLFTVVCMLLGASPANADRDFWALATADPQYWIPDGDPLNVAADEILDTVMGVRRTGAPGVRGIIIAGDLTQDADFAEFRRYRDFVGGANVATGDLPDNEVPILDDEQLGESIYVYDGLGNHDYLSASSGDVSKKINSWVRRDRAEDIIRDSDGPHYSWNWDDVHFVQLNNLAADDASAFQPTHDPYGALTFLIDNLKVKVADTGRPVVIVHHIGFTCFATGKCLAGDPPEFQEWWTHNQRRDYWNAIKDYNVVAILVGHNHWDLFDPGRGTEQECVNGPPSCITDFLKPPNDPTVEGRPDGRTSIPSWVVGAARHRIYTAIQFNAAHQMIVERRDHGRSLLWDECIDLDNAFYVGPDHAGFHVGTSFYPFTGLQAAIDAIGEHVPKARSGVIDPDGPQDCENLSDEHIVYFKPGVLLPSARQLSTPMTISPATPITIGLSAP